MCKRVVAVEDPDLELVRLAQSGTRRAFDMLVVRHQRRVARLISRYVRSPDDVEELTQETFLKAYRGILSFRGESRFSTWLHRIAEYTAHSFLDYSRLRPRAAPADPENDEPTVQSVDEDNPERVLMSKQIAETIARAVGALPEVERDALMAREIEGLSYEQIAERAGCPAATIRTRVFRARERVAAALRPQLQPMRGRRW